MSNTDWNESNPSDTVAGYESAAAPGCQAAGLKGLLTAIVSQISEADRRQADTLNQLQDRLASMGRDAKSLRDKVPDKFQFAFERIEAGMAELAARIAETGVTAGADASRVPGLTACAPHDFKTEPPGAPSYQLASHTTESNNEPPMALRSAASGSGGWRREDTLSKPAAPDVDTFDVIESLPGDVTDPWNSDSAGALADVYDSDPATFPQGTYAQPPAEAARVYAAASPQEPSVDHSWLERRFAEISERIETSIAEIRPDQSFFALGQRLDQFERSFAQAFENVATRNDVESVRLIEAHMLEMVEHLESSQSHLVRIETIESQLAAIAGRLEEIHALANAAGSYEYAQGDGAGAIDVAAIVKAASDEAAARFANASQSAADESALENLRVLLEESMSNARQSEENTTALLDTLQQAMIRLLDRMDAIEFGQHQRSGMTMAPAVHPAAMSPSFKDIGAPADPGRVEANFDDALSRPMRDPGPIGLDQAVAAVAASKSAPSSYRAPVQAGHEGIELAAPPPKNEPRKPEKLRQDFIADARRAKMRLAAEAGDEDSVVLNAPEREPITSPPPPAAKPGKPAKATAGPAAERKTAAISPRVVALSVALAIASGAYFLMPFGKSDPGSRGAMMNQTSAPVENATDVTKSAPGSKAAAASGTPSDTPPPDADFNSPDKPAQLNLHRMEGRLDSEDTANAASLPMSGVAVAHEITSPDQLERARRDHAMASLSTRLGQAAAENPAIVSPAALDLNAAPMSQAPEVAPDANRRSALDMPPAMVGPLSLRLAAANGDPSAEFEVGARIAEGKGPDQNFKEAAKWYLRSASKGFAQAQYRLGTLYERGLGVKKDEARAKEWYGRAAEQGNVKAMHNLAVLSANGKTASPDYALAARWFAEAADGGLADSQFNLAVLYENGLGVSADMRQSYKWLSLAARGGDKEAVRRRDIMKGKLTAAELAEAEKMANAFRPRATDPMINDARTAGEAWKKNSPNEG